MIITVENEKVFYPMWGGNSEQPEGERIAIYHRFLKPGERKKFIYTKPIKLDMNTGKVDGSVEYIQDEVGITKAIITKIENLTVQDKTSGKKVDVKTGRDLYETAGVPQGLVAEIESYLLSAEPEVNEDFLSEH